MRRHSKSGMFVVIYTPLLFPCFKKEKKLGDLEHIGFVNCHHSQKGSGVWIAQHGLGTYRTQQDSVNSGLLN